MATRKAGDIPEWEWKDFEPGLAMQEIMCTRMNSCFGMVNMEKYTQIVASVSLV